MKSNTAKQNAQHLSSRISPVILVLLAMLITTSSVSANHLTLISTGLTPNPDQINIFNTLSKTTLPLKKSLNAFYQLRDFKLVWSDGESYHDNTKQLIQAIQRASIYGLTPAEYDYQLLESFLKATSIDRSLISKSDVVFSHAYIKLVSHMKKGRLNDTQSLYNNRHYLLSMLSSAADDNKIFDVINKLKPKHDPYNNLIKALNHYRSLNISDNVIKLTERSYELGDSSSEIPKIRLLLKQFGDLELDQANENELASELFDENLMTAVRRFQMRHGLTADGILGKRTVRELNTPIWRRIQQLELNLARAQSLPDISSGKHILVNIPAYKLYLYDNHQLTYKSNVVVGKKKHKTPVISSELTKIILSPYWNVPRSITRNEIIPKVQQDPHYLVKNNMRLLSTTSRYSDYIDPYTIDWHSVDPYNLNFRVRQEPGHKNSLGKIKFIFPNSHSVYLHDTPSRGLFAQQQRAFSHGCIRLEDPFGLAETLLSKSTGWSKYDLLDISKQSRSKTLPLDNPVPIHLTYMTAWADELGIVNFRPDIYNQDSKPLASLYNAAL